MVKRARFNTHFPVDVKTYRVGKNLHGRKHGRSQSFNYVIGNETTGGKSMARTAIASADEANGWLKPEKYRRKKRERKEAKGEAVTAAKCLILHPSTALHTLASQGNVLSPSANDGGTLM